MSLIDRYIARQYLLSILALVVILFSFIVAIDVSLNFSRFWRVAGEVSQTTAGPPDSTLRHLLVTLVLVADLWWPRLLSLFNFMLGLVLVGAMGFTCTQLVRHRELVALLSGGQSVFRVMRPILIVAAGMTLLQGLNQELVIPRIAPLLTRDSGDAGKRDLGSVRLAPTSDGRGRLFYAAEFDADRGTLRDLSIWERDEAGLATRRIHADVADWRDGAWELTRPTIESRTDAKGGGGGASETPPTRIETDLDPTVMKIRRYARYGMNLSWSEAHEILTRMDAAGLATEQARRNHDQVVRTCYGRISNMLCNFLTLCISMGFFLTRVPGSMMAQSLKCAPVGIVSLVGAVLGTNMPIPRVPPEVSVFLPAMILLPVAIAMVSRVKT